VVRKPRFVASAERTLRRLDARITSFTRRFAMAEKEIENIIFRGLLNKELFSVKQRRQLRQDTQSVLRALYREREEQIQDLLTEHFLLGQRLTEEGLGVTVSQSSLQKQTQKILLENLVTDLNSAIDLVGRRVDDVFRKEGLRAAQEMARNGDVSTATAKMRERLVRDGITSFVDAKGRRWTLTDYTRMTVKTTTSQAQNRATEIAVVERGFSVVEVNQVENPCKVCLPYNGEVVSLTGDVPGLMHLKEIPPFHPECRHFIYPNARTIEERQKQLEVTHG
jgi:hypothetical protein